MRVYNFSAGPSILYEEVLKQAADEMLDYQGTGMSVAEMSHRSKPYMAINDEITSLLKELLEIPDNYKVLLVQGGASTQFEAIPLNLMSTYKKAEYVVTGNFAKKASKEAKKYGEVVVVADTYDKNNTYLPTLTDDMFSADVDYTHITSNNTIFGTEYKTFPNTKAPLVCDMSSDILSRPIDVSKFGLIYAGAQKNIGPAGLTIVIVREDLIGKHLPICPTMLAYQTQADNDSLYNTPPCYSIYMAMLTLRHIKKLGGLKEVQKINEYKAGLLYDYIDSTDFYQNNVAKEARSVMNVPFVTKSAELDAKFISEAAKAGLVSLKGHRLVGGMRASIYNAMPVEGVLALIEFMKKFEKENR
ncbi:MAG: 3-phosphoserine/phosphohydroxythreonine transaminase [Clostridia bacterium]|nr:3-phosphoserine/phosphohydroxythreonine transaminase [Clostridia bacterium]MBR2874744.1 3-phosphoserine/phosphohydroxythreonine transaminase [Clostridia bacterium]